MKTILVDAVNVLVLKNEGVFDEMHALLEQYPNRKIVLTGANDEEYEKFNLAEVPYELFTLKHDPEKTDPAYYRKLLQHFGLSPEEVVYFEHNPAAVKSAESVGITTHYYDPEQQDLTALKQFLEADL